MFDVDLAYPLTLGLVAAFNPCGFAMLPAYVSYFLGLESEHDTNLAKNLLRAVVVGVTMTAGFMTVFGLIGILTSSVVSEGAIARRVPYVTFAMGFVMIALGISMVRGYEPKLNIRRLQVGGGSAQLPSVFLFGVSYAVVSISCTIGLFLAAVTRSFSGGSVVEGTAVYLAYASGMGLIVLVLSVGVALARSSVATTMRRVLPHVNRISGVMLGLTGIYLVIYGWWEIQVLRGNSSDNRFVSAGTDLQTRVQQWVNDAGPGRLAMAITVLVVAAILHGIVSGLARRNDRRTIWAGFAVLWLLLEGLRYDFDLLILPTVRTIADAPVRVAHWFTDPLRWPVLFEILALAALAGIAWALVRARMDGPTDPPGSAPFAPTA